jgi:hypothetical protein
MEPLTEHRGISGPVVFGYLRLVKATTGRQQALAAALAEYCRQHELVLASVFTERSADRAVAFTGLLDVLALPDSYGVVLPAASHLGPGTEAVERERRITDTGARLLLVRGTRRPHLGLHAPLRTAHSPAAGPGPLPGTTRPEAASSDRGRGPRPWPHRHSPAPAGQQHEADHWDAQRRGPS